MPDFVDPYLEPASGILRNRLGLTDRATLDRAEAELTEWRRAEMITRPVQVTGDVYDWAGQLRTVDIRKGTDPGAEFFMPVSRLESGAGFAFAELADEHQLHGLDRDRFVDRLAHHYDQVNYLHPFREGNGRTQRIFWTQIAAGAGFDLDWSRVTGAENDRASRAAMERQDFTELRGIFDRIVQPAAGGRLTPERMEQLRAFANLSSSVAPGRSAPSTSTGRSRRPTTPGREAEQGRDL